MITFNGKQVIVTGARSQYAQVHFAHALGTSAVVEISDLRSTTIHELADVLLNAPQVDVSGQTVLEVESIGTWAGDDDGSEGTRPASELDDLETKSIERERDEWEGLADAPY